MIDTKHLTIKKAADALSRGDFSAVDLATEYLKNIEEKNKTINAYIEIYDDVLMQAKRADERIKSGKGTILTGIPLAVKDNILVSGKKATSASKILEGFVAPYDATAITKLKQEGVVFLGRTNMDEFAMGGSTEKSAYGPTKNPYDLSRVPGGTSGGSAAAVSSDMALAALGSDTGGSIRQPSAFCGLFGLKPTYGAVSRYGLMAAASSFDQIGPMAKSVEDVEILFNAIKGRDAFDSTSINLETRRSLEKIRIGVPYHFMKDGIDGDVRSNFDETILMLKKAGCEIKEITLPHISYSLATYYVIIFAEESSNLSRFDGVKYGLRVESDSLLKEYLGTRTAGFGREVRRRIMLGNYILSSGYYDAYYNKANAVRELLRTDFSKTFNDVDVVLTPTSPVPAFKIGEKSGDPLSMYLADIFTVTANLVGNPAISVPSGVTEREGKKLPLGVQFMSSHGREDILFNVARKFPGA